MLYDGSVILLEAVGKGGLMEPVEQPVPQSHVLGVEVPGSAYALCHDIATNLTTSSPMALRRRIIPLPGGSAFSKPVGHSDDCDRPSWGDNEDCHSTASLFQHGSYYASSASRVASVCSHELRFNGRECVCPGFSIIIGE